MEKKVPVGPFKPTRAVDRKQVLTYRVVWEEFKMYHKTSISGWSYIKVVLGLHVSMIIYKKEYGLVKGFTWILTNDREKRDLRQPRLSMK